MACGSATSIRGVPTRLHRPERIPTVRGAGRGVPRGASPAPRGGSWAVRASLSSNDFRPGVTIEMDGAPWRVQGAFSTPRWPRGTVRCETRGTTVRLGPPSPPGGCWRRHGDPSMDPHPPIIQKACTQSACHDTRRRWNTRWNATEGVDRWESDARGECARHQVSGTTDAYALFTTQTPSQTPPCRKVGPTWTSICSSTSEPPLPRPNARPGAASGCVEGIVASIWRLRFFTLGMGRWS